MKLLRTRPKLRVRIPRWVTPGVQFPIDVLLDARRAVEVDDVSVAVVGRVGYPAQAGSYEILRLVAHPSGPRELPIGTSSFRVHAELPVGAPPTYPGVRCRVEWSIEVHASVPWWPDARERFELAVGVAGVSSVESEPAIYATRGDGPTGDEPYAELSLATQAFAPGEAVRGAIAVYGVERHRYRGATISLRSIEKVGDAEGPGTSWQIQLPLVSATEGAAIPFGLVVPAGVTPTFQHAVARLDWKLGVSIATGWSSTLDLQVPITITSSMTTQADGQPRTAYPPLGEERVRGVWASVGARHGLTLRDDTLEVIRGSVRLRVHRGRTARGSALLVATLEHTPLHLGLIVSRRSLGSRLLASGAGSGHAWFDERYEVRGRSSAQAHAWMSRVAPLVLHPELRELSVALDHMDDQKLAVVVTDSGTSEAALERFVRGALTIADGLDGALGDIPLPPGLDESLQALGDAEAALGGTLERGHARIVGARDGVRAELSAILGEEGHAVGLRVVVTPDGGVHIRQSRMLAAGELPPAGWPTDAKQALAALGGAGVALDETQLTALFECGADGVAAHLERAVALVDACVRLALAFRMGAGPFR